MGDCWPEWTLSLVAGPAVEPIALDDVKEQIRITNEQENRLLQTLITAGREYAEAFTQRALITQTWDVVFDRFPAEGWIVLPRAPLVSVTSIVYVPIGGGPAVTWDPALYKVEAPAGPTAQRGRVIRPYGTAWPVCQQWPGAVTVRIVAGYGPDGAAVPAAIRVAMAEWVADGWAQRGNLVYGPVATAHDRDWLLWPFKAW